MKNAFLTVAAALCAVAAAGEVKLSLQAYTFRDRTFVETVATAQRLGFERLEAYPGQRLGGGMEGTTDYNSIKPESLLKLKEFLAASPVKVVSYGVTGAGGDAGWAKLAAFCKELGIGEVRIEANGDKSAYDAAERAARKHGIRVSLHNHRQAEGRPQPVLEALTGRDNAAFGACPDIGHWTRADADALAGIALLKGRIHAIHLIDVAPKSCGSRDVPLGSGVIDVKGVLDLLAKEPGDVFATVEYEHQSRELEQEVATCVRWFRAWQRGELDAAGRLSEGAFDALWNGVTGADADSWEFSPEIKESMAIAEKAKTMKALEIDPATLRADRKGFNDREDVASAFGSDKDRKYCREWADGAFVACAFRAPAKVRYYTVSSSNDAPGRDPAAWTLYGSDDGENWTALDTRAKQEFQTRFMLRGFEVKEPRPFKFVKFAVESNRGGDPRLQFSRLQFFE